MSGHTAQIAEGMNAAAQNARRLYGDATVLLESGSYPTAAAIALLAVEEAGKVAVLRGMSLAKSADEYRASWKAYRNHSAKQNAWSFRALPFDFAIPGTDHHAALFDSFKQAGLYTDCVGQLMWIRPGDFIDEATARRFFADTVTPLLEPVKRVFSAREVELWREHLGPVWKKDSASVHAAIAAWGNALKAEGLDSAFDVAGMVAFVPPRREK